VNSRYGFNRVIVGLVGAILLEFGAAHAAETPEGIDFNGSMETYTVGRVPTRTLDAVQKSIESWRHQVLADGSTADYTAEDGILAMECSACGQGRPSAIEVAKIDLKSVMAYQAGNWNIGIRSTDGAQDFRGLLRGELGPGPHDATRVSENKRVALVALQDLYDLAYLTQFAERMSTLQEAPAAAATAAKPAAISLASLSSAGDVEGILAQQRAKPGSRDIASALETAYGARARLQLLAGDVDAALQTLSAARRSFGKSAALRDLEAHYVVVGDAFDRLRWGVKLDVPGMQGYLQQIRTLEPRDATSIELMLVQTLSNRIADQRAAGRGAIADELLASGGTLFPEYADVLTRGKAGALPEGGIEVGTIAPGNQDTR
jgi:hypothetical protein